MLTTGIAGQRSQKGWVIAASVCGTIEALTSALAVELAPMRVNAVSPGVVRTSLWQKMSAPEGERLHETVGNSLAVRRIGEAHEIAQAYLFLMQEGFATGQTVVIDDGTVLVQTLSAKPTNRGTDLLRRFQAVTSAHQISVPGKRRRLRRSMQHWPAMKRISGHPGAFESPNPQPSQAPAR